MSLEKVLILEDSILTATLINGYLENNGFNICCPKCHSQDYDVYPTGINPFDKDDPINDIWYKCDKCDKKWSSEFLKNNKGRASRSTN